MSVGDDVDRDEGEPDPDEVGDFVSAGYVAFSEVNGGSASMHTTGGHAASENEDSTIDRGVEDMSSCDEALCECVVAIGAPTATAAESSEVPDMSVAVEQEEIKSPTSGAFSSRGIELSPGTGRLFCTCVK